MLLPLLIQAAPVSNHRVLLPVSADGRAETAVTRDAQGRVVDCRIVRSSGNVLVDRNTCRAAVRRPGDRATGGRL